MPRSLVAPAVALLVLTAGCTVLGATSAEVTVENERATEYTLTAYILHEPAGAGNVTFRATGDSDARKTVDAVQIGMDGPYSNVILADEWDATVRQRTIPANETTTATLEEWDSGDPVVYLFSNREGRVVRFDYADCPRDSMEHTFVFSDGPENGMRIDCL